ncbi:MAG TPA: NUDIX domain-containing protein [Acidobacteriota bacterium]|nr:NUDIX domain-containing protein [Acidobacteriota bacterium]
MAQIVPKPTKDFTKYQMPGVAVDIILFTIRNNRLMVGLIKREDDPYFGAFALPGRFVRYDEKIEDTAKQALQLKCGIDPAKVYLEQLYTFGQNLDRDTRIRTITIIYYGIIKSNDTSFESGTKLSWHNVSDLPKLAFDHSNIIAFAADKLKSKTNSEHIAFKFLADEFTLTQAQKTYETLLGTALDKRNFRKKIMELDLVTDTRKKFQEGVHRPAALYRFSPQK